MAGQCSADRRRRSIWRWECETPFPWDTDIKTMGTSQRSSCWCLISFTFGCCLYFLFAPFIVEFINIINMKIKISIFILCIGICWNLVWLRVWECVWVCVMHVTRGTVRACGLKKLVHSENRWKPFNSFHWVSLVCVCCQSVSLLWSLAQYETCKD